MLHVCKTWRALQRAAPSNHIIHELIRDNVSRQSQEDGNYHLNLSNLRHHYSEESVNHHDVISMRFLSTAKRLAQQVPRIHAAATSILISGCGTGDTALELAKLWTPSTAIAHLTFVDGPPDMLRQTEIKLDIVNKIDEMDLSRSLPYCEELRDNTSTWRRSYSACGCPRHREDSVRNSQPPVAPCYSLSKGAPYRSSTRSSSIQTFTMKYVGIYLGPASKTTPSSPQRRHTAGRVFLCTR